MVSIISVEGTYAGQVLRFMSSAFCSNAALLATSNRNSELCY